MSIEQKIKQFVNAEWRRFRQIAGFTSSSLKPKAEDVLVEYVTGLPCAQNAIDALEGWNTALPPEVAVTAGHVPLYQDPRIFWAIEQFGSLEGRKVLELGPLEASHTYILERAGAAGIDSIEANKLCYLRCLVVKELLNLKTPHFYLGDFVPWLESSDRRYDLIVASGVLYHMADPVHLLELIAKRTNAFYLWTHYASDEAMPVGDVRRMAFVSDASISSSHGVDVRLYERRYWGAWKNKSFCGGMHDLHRWIEREDILALIRALGFDDVRTAHDEPAHSNGPSFSIFARRTTC